MNRLTYPRLLSIKELGRLFSQELSETAQAVLTQGGVVSVPRLGAKLKRLAPGRFELHQPRRITLDITRDFQVRDFDLGTGKYVTLQAGSSYVFKLIDNPQNGVGGWWYVIDGGPTRLGMASIALMDYSEGFPWTSLDEAFDQMEVSIIATAPNRATVNDLGDLVCPCGVQIITPIGAVVLPGISGCRICGQKFEVTPDTAALANKRWGL